MRSAGEKGTQAPSETVREVADRGLDVLPRFHDRVSLVTGAGSGIGRTASLALAREGAKSVVADIDAAGGEETVALLQGLGADALFVKADVSKSAEVEALVKTIIERYGRLDCAFNNAGIMGMLYCPTADCPEENWDRVLNTNLKGVWLCMKYEILQMRKQGRGAIVNMSSVAGLNGSFASAPYTASKHGIIGLTKATALECAKSGIRVNAVCPGYIRTAMTEKITNRAPKLAERMISREPIGRLGTPEEVATAVLWLLSDEASFVTGHALVIDGGIEAG